MEKHHHRLRTGLGVRAVIGRTLAGAERMYTTVLVFIHSLLRRGAAAHVLRFAGNALAGFLLARTTVFGEYAPFGVGFAAASSGMPGFAGALVGVLGGSLSMSGRIDMLKYITAALFIVAAAFLLRGLLSSESIVFPPVAAGSAFLLVGLAYLAGRGFASFHILLSITELVLAGGSGYFFRIAKRTIEGSDEESIQRRAVCIFLLSAALLASLSQLMLLGAVSVGRVLSSAFIIALAVQTGMYGGAVAGVILGVTMDLAAGNVPLFTAAYSFAGFFSGVFSRAGRVSAAAAYIVINAAVILWSGGGSANYPALYEACAASLIFAFIPVSLLELVRPALALQSESSTAHTEKLRSYITSRLTGTSAAFRELREMIVPPRNKSENNDQNAAALFTGAATAVCRNCEHAARCWNTEYNDTRDMLNSTVPTILRKGRADRSDLPERFGSRCTRLGEFVAEVNRGLYSSLCRKRYRSALNENRELLGGQYDDISHLLEQACKSIARGLRFDVCAERRIRRCLVRYNSEFSVLVYYTNSDRCNVEIEGNETSALVKDSEKITQVLQRITGRTLLLSEQENHKEAGRLLFAETEEYLFDVGASAAKKIGSEVSGDCGTYFKTSNDFLYVILSDGMGSGREAALESSMAVRLLERFLRAGLNAELAVRIVGSAMFLRNEDGMRATIDVACISLVTGLCTIIKCGAAASYTASGRNICRISPSPVPTDGLMGSVTKTQVSLSEGGMMLLMSDGVLDDENDAWLRELLVPQKNTAIKTLTSEILKASPHNGVDDMTAIAIRISKNKETGV